MSQVPWCKKGMPAVYKGRPCTIESIDGFRLPDDDDDVSVVINIDHRSVNTLLSFLKPPETAYMVHNPTFTPEQPPVTSQCTDKPANDERVKGMSPHLFSVFVCFPLSFSFLFFSGLTYGNPPSHSTTYLLSCMVGGTLQTMPYTPNPNPNPPHSTTYPLSCMVGGTLQTMPYTRANGGWVT